MAVSLPTIDSSSTQVGARSNLLQLLLNEQQNLSAVERFSQLHDQNGHVALESHYQALMPTKPLEEGQQYAFHVDLDRCSGCKACVTACHSLNGLDESETWRDVGLLYGNNNGSMTMQHVTTACHHCVDPACLNGCPTNAYEKDPITGIVKHLDDQCFGCQYCTLTCPYGVPKYHEEKGIVRKCDMCSQRLEVGEAPACAQACPHEAISITTVDIEEVKQKAENGDFISGAHDPSYTIPTTTYSTEKLPQDLSRGDLYDLKPEHGHLPLVVMLVLTQCAAGGFLWIQLLRSTSNGTWLSSLLPILSLICFGIGQLALMASTIHLGRPLYAPRGILGFFHSWLSREIVAFGAFAATSGAFASSYWIPVDYFPFRELVRNVSGVGMILSGYLGIFCSMKIYAVTQRVFWNHLDTSIKFLLTSIIMGSSVSLVVITTARLFQVTSPAWVSQLMMTSMVVSLSSKLIYESSIFRHLIESGMPPLKKTALLMIRPLFDITLARYVLGIVSILSALMLTFTLESSILAMSIAFSAFTFALLGELLERYLFFTAVVAPQMPRGVRP